MKKKSLYKGMAMLTLMTAIASCQKDTLPTNFAPGITAGNVDGIERTHAKAIYGKIDNPNGYKVEEYGIQYSLYQSFAESKSLKATNLDAKGEFSVPIEGLEPGTSYFYRTYVFSGHNTVYSDSRSFQTPKTAAPLFDTEKPTTVSNVKLTSFDVQATLLDDGGEEGGIQMRAFIYMPIGDDEELDITITTPNVVTKIIDGFTTTIDGLFPGTRYVVRPAAVNGSGVGYGTSAYVTTTYTVDNLLSSCVLSDTTSNSISVETQVLNVGTHGIVEGGFCYTSESQTPTISNVTVQAEGYSFEQGSAFKATLSGLNAATTYYIRAYTKDNQGSVAYSETIEYTVAAHQDLDVLTFNASDISPISANLWGNIRQNNVPVRERGICWSTTEFQVENNTETANVNYVAANTDDERYFVTLDVNFNTTYYFCAYGKNSAGVIYYGDVLSFTTPDINVPIFAIDDATNITEASATISGTVTLDYEYRADYRLKCGFLVSKSHTEPTLETNEINEDLSVTLGAHLTDDDVVLPLNATFDLEPDTQYYYRIYAENEKGLVYSEVKTFTTLKRTPTPDDAEFPELN